MNATYSTTHTALWCLNYAWNVQPKHLHSVWALKRQICVCVCALSPSRSLQNESLPLVQDPLLQCLVCVIGQATSCWSSFHTTSIFNPLGYTLLSLKYTIYTHTHTHTEVHHLF